MRTTRGLLGLALLGGGVLLAVLGSPVAQADAPVETALTLVRETPADYPAVFHDRIDHGAGSLPGTDYIDYRATLTSAGAGVPGQPVVLQRMLAPGSTWQDVGSAITDQDGVAEFSTPVRGNATYQATYAGDDAGLLAASASGPLTLQAMRDFNAVIVQNPSGVYLRGNVNPGWAGRRISWDKRACATCDWRTLTSARASSTGAWSFKGAFPHPGGTWWFRARLGGTASFITSTSSMLETRMPAARLR